MYFKLRLKRSLIEVAIRLILNCFISEIETLEIFERLLPCSFNKCTTAYGVRCKFVPACINKARRSIGYFNTETPGGRGPIIYHRQQLLNYLFR